MIKNKMIKNQIGGMLHCPQCGNDFNTEPVDNAYRCPRCHFSFTTINITVRTRTNNFNINISPETRILYVKSAIYNEHPEYEPYLQNLYINRPGATADFPFPIILDNYRKYSDYPIENNTIKLFIEDREIFYANLEAKEEAGLEIPNRLGNDIIDVDR